MSEYKNDLRGLSIAELRSRRDRLAVGLLRAGQFLAGSLAEQHRKCGKEGCRCTRGELHGPYVYLSAAGRMIYLSATLADAVRSRLEISVRLRGFWRRSRRSTSSCWPRGSWTRP